MVEWTKADEIDAKATALLKATRLTGFQLSDKPLPLKWRSITLQAASVFYAVFFPGFIDVMA